MRRRKFITLLSAAGIVISQSPVFAQTFFAYSNRDGSEFFVAFFERDRLAHLQVDGKAVALSKRVSLSGLRYAKGDITLRIMKTVTTLRRGKRSTECTAV
jgi:membrane-bound inhibitor of C-type lysozyme